MRLLIIEDNEKLVNNLKLGLEREGFAVDYKLDGDSGERWLAINYKNYDAVILDIMLPGMDGITLCKTVRSKGVMTPVLMLTARDETLDKVAGLDAGADDYLVKPFSFDELTARIRALLRRPQIVLPVELKLGELTISPNNLKAFYREKEIVLTLKEYTMLEYFVRNKDQVLSREQILDHVWDSSMDTFSNIVDVHVKNLRKKLDSFGYGKNLETVRGVGYRLKA